MKLGIIALPVVRFVTNRVLALTLGKLKVEADLCLIEYQQALVVVSVFGNKVELATLAVLEDLLQLLVCDFMTSEGLLTLKIATLTLVSTAVIFDFIFAVRNC